METLDTALAEIACHYRTSLFDQIAATDLTPSWIYRFDSNFRLRTLLTIPEVFCTGISVANYFDLGGIAAAGSIVADEAGVCPNTLKPNPMRVHSNLLGRAFDSLRARVCALPALNAGRLLCLMRSLDRLTTLKSTADATEERWNLVRADLGSEHGRAFVVPVRFSSRAATTLAESVTRALLSEGVTSDTIVYCHSQFRMQRCDNPARVIGRALMHEYLADGMLSRIEELLFLPFRERWEDAAYQSEVAPYFLAHRNEAEGSYIEVEHAERMCAIAAPFVKSPLMREPLLQEATRFAAEQQRLFDALLPNSSEALHHHRPLRTAAV